MHIFKITKSITVEGGSHRGLWAAACYSGLNLPLKVEVHFALVGDNNGIRTYRDHGGRNYRQISQTP